MKYEMTVTTAQLEEAAKEQLYPRIFSWSSLLPPYSVSNPLVRQPQQSRITLAGAAVARAQVAKLWQPPRVK